MLQILASHLYQNSKTESELIAAGLRGSTTIKEHPTKTKGSNNKPLIDLDYIDNKLQALFKHRQNKEIDSRIRFKVQDLMDDYDKLWKFEIYKQR